MNNHLSQDQFEKCLLGGGGPSEVEHLRECSECRTQVERFSKGLALFRRAIRDLAGDPVAIKSADFATWAPASSTGIARWRWAIASATLVAAIILPFFISRPKPVVNTPVEMSPDAVMERLNRHLSGTVPEAMEPVMSLISAEHPASEPERAQ
jgi:hypothetical protein